MGRSLDEFLAVEGSTQCARSDWGAIAILSAACLIGTASALSAETPLAGPGAVYTAYGWSVLNNVWNPGKLKYGRDYTIRSEVDPLDLTARTTFWWTFPATKNPYPPIRAYPEVIFGVSPYGDRNNPTDLARVLPIRVDRVAGLTADYEIGISGNGKGFNVAFDIWLTDQAYGDETTITNEVMLWVRAGSLVPAGDKVGDFASADFSGPIHHTGTYTAIAAEEFAPSGRIDIAAVLSKLKRLGIVGPDEFIASIEFGAEVAFGQGSLSIRNLDLMVAKQGASGVTVNEVTGAGTTVTQRPAGGP